MLAATAAAIKAIANSGKSAVVVVPSFSGIEGSSGGTKSTGVGKG